MQDVKTQQSVGVHFISAQHQEANLFSHQRNGLGDVGADRDSPERQLVPWQEITGVTEQQSDKQKEYADHPIKLPGWTIRSAVKNLEHVCEYLEDHRVGRPAMQVSQKYAGSDHKLQIFHVRIRLRYRWVVIKHEQ